MRKRFAELTEGLAVPAPATQPAASGAESPAAARTAPGQMMVFREERVRDAARIAELEAQLANFVGSLPVRELEPARIRPSHFANRHESHYRTAAFEQLKSEIRRADGNVQPIWVRPLAPGTDAAHDYEIVFGHRRLRACAELGLSVRAVVAEVGADKAGSEREQERALFLAMTMENLAREDLSPYELGQHYERALKGGLYENQEVLAAAFGRTAAHVSQALRVARLPDEIVLAFPTPVAIQYRWAAEINAIVAGEDRAARRELLERARKAKANASLSAKQVYEFLVGKDRKAGAEVERDLMLGERRLGTLRFQDGQVAITLARGVVARDSLAQVEAALLRVLGKHAQPDGNPDAAGSR